MAVTERGVSTNGLSMPNTTSLWRFSRTPVRLRAPVTSTSPTTWSDDGGLEAAEAAVCAHAGPAAMASAVAARMTALGEARRAASSEIKNRGPAPAGEVWVEIERVMENPTSYIR